MPRNKAAASELGTIHAHGAEFRAHIKFRNDAGEQKHIHGPSRATENEALASQQPASNYTKHRNLNSTQTTKHCFREVLWLPLGFTVTFLWSSALNLH